MSSRLIKEYEGGERAEPGSRDLPVTKKKAPTAEELAKAAAEAADKAAEEQEIKEQEEAKKNKKVALQASKIELRNIELRFQQELEELLASLSDPIDKLWAWTVNVCKPLYNDLISDLGCELSSPLFVDGDSLLFEVLSDPRLDWHHGGEWEHVLFLLLGSLQQWVDVKMAPHVVFFRDSLVLWAHDPRLLLMRRLFHNFLRHRTAIPIIDQYDSPSSEEFSALVFRSQPSCFILSDGSTFSDSESDPHSLLPSRQLSKALFALNIFHALTNANVHCALTRNLQPKDQHVTAFVFSPVQAPPPLVFLALDELAKITSSTSASTFTSPPSTSISSMPNGGDLNLAVAQELVRQYTPLAEHRDLSLELLRVYAFHLHLVHSLPVSARLVPLESDVVAADHQGNAFMGILKAFLSDIAKLLLTVVGEAPLLYLDGKLLWKLIEVMTSSSSSSSVEDYYGVENVEHMKRLFPDVATPFSVPVLTAQLGSGFPRLGAQQTTSELASPAPFITQHSSFFSDLFVEQGEPDFGVNAHTTLAEAKASGLTLGTAFPERYTWELVWIEAPDAHLKVTVPTDPRKRRYLLRAQQRQDAFFHRYAQSLSSTNELGLLRMMTGKIVANKQAEASAAVGKGGKAAGKQAATASKQPAANKHAAKGGKATGNSRAEEIKLQNTLKREHEEIVAEIARLENNRRAFSGSFDETYSKLSKFISESKYPLATIQGKIYALELCLRMWADAYHKHRSHLTTGPSPALEPRAGLYYAIRSVRLIFEVVDAYTKLPNPVQTEELVALARHCLSSLGLEDAVPSLKALVASRTKAPQADDDGKGPAASSGPGAKGTAGKGGKGRPAAKGTQRGAAPVKAPAMDAIKIKMPVIDIGKVPLGVSFYRFQLAYCGPHMERGIPLFKDERVSFSPEEWQLKLINVVDHNEGALVVAPTSSGKTFVSYYAMKKVLLESDDNVVVYVAPTPSLVNQAAAEVYARFSSKKYPERSHMRVWGTYTSDYRVHPLNAQVLITIPEIFESLLLSPDHAKPGGWVSRIRYIILDEVHCMGSLQSGAMWERIVSLAPAPIIALSATLGNPDVLFNWIQSSQSARDIKTNLISHKWRFAHLYHYQYVASQACPTVNWDEFSSVHPPSQSKRSPVVAVGAPQTQALARIHPVGCLTPLDIRRGALANFDLAPDNALKLYESLLAVASSPDDKRQLAHLSPDAYFRDRPNLIDYVAVRQYAQELKGFLQAWSDQASAGHADIAKNLDIVLDTLFTESNAQTSAALTSAAAAASSSTSSTTVDPLFKLLIELSHHDLLPTLAFAFDQNICNEAFNTTLQTLRRLEEQKLNLDESANVRQNKSASRHFTKTSNSRRSDSDNEDEVALPDEIDQSGPRPEFSFVQQGHFADSFEQLIDRLKSIPSISDDLIEGLHRGIGVHHDNVHNKYRQAVETLFRSKHVRVVFCTQTLAMGINMPCRSVVFLADSVFLNPTYFQQMSGRSGRRGFDLVGHVIFFKVMWPKIQRLMVCSLPSLSGSSLLSVSLVARLLCVYNTIGDKRQATANIQHVLSHRPLKDTRSSAVRSLISDDRFPRFFLRFSLEYLTRIGIIDNFGNMLGNFGFVPHLAHVEPANLEFATLMSAGYFHDICADYDNSSVDTQRQLMVVLSHLFGTVFWCSSSLPGIDPSATLPPMPPAAAEILARVESSTLNLFLQMLAEAVPPPSPSESLPLINPDSSSLSSSTSSDAAPSTACFLGSSSTPHIRSLFPALSASAPLASLSELRTSSRAEITPALTSFPIAARTDNQGRKRLPNSYLLEFWRTGDIAHLVHKERISPNQVWYLIRDFVLIVHIIGYVMRYRKKHIHAVAEAEAASSSSSTSARSSSGNAQTSAPSKGKTLSDDDDDNKNDDTDDSDLEAWDVSDSDDETTSNTAVASSSSSSSGPAAPPLESAPLPAAKIWTRADEMVLRAFSDLYDVLNEKFKAIK